MYLMFFVFGFLYNDLLDLVVEPTCRKWRKECEFDCSKCKVWDCSRKQCLKYKEKVLKGGVK